MGNFSGPPTPNTDTLLTHRKGHRMKARPCALCNLDAITPILSCLRFGTRNGRKNGPEAGRTLIGRPVLDETEYECTFNRALKSCYCLVRWTRNCLLVNSFHPTTRAKGVNFVSFNRKKNVVYRIAIFGLVIAPEK